MSHLCGCCGGGVGSIIPVFKQFHRSGISLEFEDLYESAWQVISDLQQKKGKINHSFKNSTSIGLQQCQIKKLSKKGFWHRSKIFAKSFKGLAMLSSPNRALSTFKNVMKVFIRCQNSFFENLSFLTLLENNRSAVFEAASYVAFSPP